MKPSPDRQGDPTKTDPHRSLRGPNPKKQRPCSTISELTGGSPALKSPSIDLQVENQIRRAEEKRQ